MTLALAYLSFFALVVDFGLNAHVLPKFLGKESSWEWQRLLGLRIIIASLATLLAAAVLLFWPQPTVFKLTVIFGLLGIIEPAVFTTAAVVFQSKLRFDLSIIASSFGSLLILGLVLLFMRQGWGNPYLMAGYSLGWFIAGILALYFARKYISNLFPVFDWAYIKRTLWESWPISLTVILNLVYFRVDAFILSHYRSFAEVGVYNLAYQVFQSLLVFPAFVMNSYYPLMLKDFQDNRLRFPSRLKKAVFLMLAIAVTGTLLTWVLAPLVVFIISGGQGFVGSVTSLQILSLGFPAFFLSSILMWTLITLRQYKTMLVIYVLGLLLNSALNFYFIPRFGYVAASWITGVSEYVILGLQLTVLVPILKKELGKS